MAVAMFLASALTRCFQRPVPASPWCTGYNLGHNWLRLFSPYRKFTYVALHVALLKPPLPQLNVDFVSWYIIKSCFGVVHNIELGGEGETKFVLSMFNNFVLLAGMVSTVLSEIVGTWRADTPS
jgi:hypothetical protein